MVSNEELFISGDIDNLYKSNKHLMYHIANKFSNLKLEEDDLIECGDLAFVRAIKSFNPHKSKWATFFSRVMTNEILMVNRKRNREVQAISIETVICKDSNQNVSTIQEIIPSPKDTMDEVINLIVTEEILMIAKKLSPKKQEVLRLYLLGTKYKDIGQVLNLNAAYVGRLIKKICLELKITYEKGA
jgi:RNA polymerase sporulation-specific sigma factor